MNSSEPVLNLLSAGSAQLLTPVLPSYYMSVAGEHSTGNSLIQSKLKYLMKVNTQWHVRKYFEGTSFSLTVTCFVCFEGEACGEETITLPVGLRF